MRRRIKAVREKHRWERPSRSAGKDQAHSLTKLGKLRARRKVRQRIEKASRRANRGSAR